MGLDAARPDRGEECRQLRRNCLDSGFCLVGGGESKEGVDCAVGDDEVRMVCLGLSVEDFYHFLVGTSMETKPASVCATQRQLPSMESIMSEEKTSPRPVIVFVTTQALTSMTEAVPDLI